MSNTNPDVHVGKDGWLFLGGGNNDFMSYMRGVKKLPSTTIDYWQIILANRKQWFEKAGIKYIHVFAPEKATVYPEFLQEKINPSFGHISALAGSCPDLFLNVLPYFNSIKETYQLYDKTDTHWNRVGAFACYQLICSVLHYEFCNDLFSGEKKSVNVLLDLGAKLSPPQREQVDLLIRSPNTVRAFANLLVRYKEKHKIENEVGLHVGSRAVFKNDSAPYPDKVVIFGDSFAEYRPGRLTEMFAETFSEVHFCWSANIDYDYVEQVRPSIVITELCERFAVTPPNDKFQTDNFARQRLKSYYLDRNPPVPVIVPELATEPSPEAVVSIKPKHRSPLPFTGLRGPDYLIVGSMKCGTTILNDYINDHPGVHPAKQKEIHYFSLYLNKGEEWYANFFDQAPDDKVTGEASPTYFDMTHGSPLPQLIGSTLPNAKIIAVIKDPVDRAISHFFHLRNINKIPAFQSLDPNVVFSGDLFRKYHEEFLMNPDLWPMRNVLDFGNYVLRLQTYKQIFGDKFIVINNSDLWTNGQAVMDRVFKHLGLTTYQSAMFERKSYVTSSSLKQIDPNAIRCLEEYYRPDVEMLNRQFGIKIR